MSRWRRAVARVAAVAWTVAGAALARAQVTVAVSAPATVAARVPVLVRVEVTAPARASVRLVPPAFTPFTLARTARVPADTAGLGGRQRLEWSFVLRPSGAGTFAFDPFAVDVQGAGLRAATFRSRNWSVAVLPPPVTPSAAVARADLAVTDPGRLDFDARVAPDRVYVGEQATLELRVGVGERVRARLHRSPEFAFPTVTGVVTYDLSARHASSAAGDVHIYRRAMFALAPGPVAIPPAQLVYALTAEDDPFGAEQRINAHTPMRRLIAVTPPTEGRPAEWTGAVGRFRASAHVDTAHARVGDAVVYTLRVEGTGNVTLLPRPALRVLWADVSAAGERVSVDTTGELAGGAKEFDWLLTPRAAGGESVPAVRYAYFDPRGGYAFADAPAVSVRVAPGTPAAVASAVARPAPRPAAPGPEHALGVRRHWGGERGPLLVARRSFWLALAAAPVPGALWLLGAAGAIRSRERRRVRAAQAAGRGASTPRAAAAVALATFTDGLSSLLARPATAQPLSASTLARALRRSGMSPALAAECAAAVDAWAEVAFGTPTATPASPVASPEPLLSRVALELGSARAAVAREAVARAMHAPADDVPDPAVAAPRRRAFPPHVVPGLAIALALLALAFGAPQLRVPPASGASAGDRVRAVAAFDAGVSAYVAGDAARARDLFAASTAAAANAPDAWVNAGTAAWVAGDTASAAFAWHRAARLAPGTPGLNARLDELPMVSGADRVGAPPRVDAALLAQAALAATALAALAALGAAASARAPAWRAATTLYVAAVALAGGAALAARAMDTRGLAVIRAAGALRPDPSAGAAGAATVATGEIARVLDDEGGWLRVQLDGGREGWLQTTQVAPLTGTL